MIYIKSDIDNDLYLVRNMPDKHRACNMLATIKKNIFILTNHLNTNKTNFKDHEAHIDQLNKRIKNCIIMESSENSMYTSYSINKGEQIVFCLRSRTSKDSLHDLNLLMYVVLHEMSHVACPEYGHTELFKQIFAFITTQAINQNMYNRIDFGSNNREYCGLNITDSIV